MALPYKFNFRGTLAYVTDAAGETACYDISGTAGGTQPDQYPTTRDGITFGWDNNTMFTANRSTLIPVQFAGCQFNDNANLATFRVDLPAAGSYVIRLAAGDYGNAFGTNKIAFFDNVTSLLTINASTSAPDRYLDANYNVNATERTSANWAANNESVTLTFATTTFFMKLGNGAGLDTGVVAHLEIDAAATTTALGLFGGN